MVNDEYVNHMIGVLSVCLSVSLALWLSVCLSVYLSVSLPLCLSVSLSLWLPILNALVST